jgi:hypothetical protein
MSSVKRLPPPSVNQETAANVLKFIGNAVVRPFAPLVAEVDRHKAAQIIQMPMRQGVAQAATDKPAVAVISKVSECIDKLFPTLRGAVRQQMIASISQKISEDPYARQLIAS